MRKAMEHLRDLSQNEELRHEKEAREEFLRDRLMPLTEAWKEV